MYNMILDGKDFDIEALMVQLDMQNSFSCVFNFDKNIFPCSTSLIFPLMNNFSNPS